ncbi:MAG: anion permease [Betaproteobacteria bacterium]|nr:anion permease [Betaproteobacteria bacterium]
MPRLSSIFAALVCVGATVIFLLPPPQGMTVTAMHAAALLVFTVGLWASGTLPEHITGFLFFLLAMVLAVAPPAIVFSGFASATLWLVLGGLILAQAVYRTGLAQRIAGALFDRYTRSYRQLVAAIVIVSIVLAFFMPATVGRVLLLMPILAAVAQRAGFERGSTGYNGICLAAIMTTYQCGTAILPANAPNLVLAGTAETLYGVQLIYAEYLWVQFPVMGILKGLAIIAFVCWLFRAEVRPAAAPHETPPLTPEQQRMAVILIVAVSLWATDFLHGIKAGWIALAAGTACFMPRIGVMPFRAFNSVNFGPYFYVGATLGLGLTVQQSGLSEALGTTLEGVLPLTAGADFGNFGRAFRAGDRLAAQGDADDDGGGFHDHDPAVSGSAGRGRHAGCRHLARDDAALVAAAGGFQHRGAAAARLPVVAVDRIYWIMVSPIKGDGVPWEFFDTV